MVAGRLLRRGLVLAVALLATVPASALADCGTQVLDDYLDDGAISGTYAKACYQSALNQMPSDVELYTDAVGAIRAAMARSGSGGSGSGSGAPPPATTAEEEQEPGTTTEEEPATTDAGTTTDELPAVTLPGTTTDAGIVGEALKDLGPKKADEVPTPVIVLGVLAILLVAAGSGGLIMQRMRRGGDAGSGDPPAPAAAN